MAESNSDHRRLTKARLRGLEVLTMCGYARRSNITGVHHHKVIGPVGYVYWQTADWLIANELAEEYTDGHLRITRLGRQELGAERVAA